MFFKSFSGRIFTFQLSNFKTCVKTKAFFKAPSFTFILIIIIIITIYIVTTGYPTLSIIYLFSLKPALNSPICPAVETVFMLMNPSIQSLAHTALNEA